ncbi:GTPase IMAP family member 8-like [Enoplosus armatus]|uniref:GTPase IMAP family member 8-like n=1 Tax=Enoplosus armatus TaxID=215367 RepID=UPI003994C52B
MAAAAASEGNQERPLRHSSSYQFIPPSMSELRVVLLGNSWSERSSVGNLILRETEFNTEEEPDGCLTVRGPLKEKEIVVINTPDLLHPNISDNKLRKHVETCVRLSDPGPHVFLLVLQPEDFTEEHKLRLCRVLQLFSDRSFDHSLVLISTPREESPGLMERHMEQPPLKDMIRICRYRHLKLKDLELPELLTRLGQTVKENIREHVSCDVFEDEDEGLIMKRQSVSGHMKPALNLVLCGRRGAAKTSAAKAILGQTELHSVSNSPESVKHQGEVCGRWVSLVELPALCGKPQEAVMEESLRSISLCDPEGVQAFILVLPVGPLTDEDKGEFETIRNTFSCRVNDFTVILFTVESDPTAPAVVDFVRKNREIQELRQSCGGRCVVLNIQDEQQIPQMLDDVEKMRAEGSRCFTKDMFTKAQMEMVSRLKAELRDVKQRSEMGADGESQSRDTEKFIQRQVERILKEKEEEMKRKDEDLRRKHEEDLKTLKRKINEQRGETEQERKLRSKQLKDKDECMKKEREERKKEREEEERKWKKQGETQRQEWRRKLEASEKIVQSEREQRGNAERKLDLCRKEMKREREVWDKERKDTWEQIRQEDKQSLQEAKTSFRKLQEEYHQKRRKWTYSLFVLLMFLLILMCYVFTLTAETKEHT